MSKYKQFPTPAAHLANYLAALKTGFNLSVISLTLALFAAVPCMIFAVISENPAIWVGLGVVALVGLIVPTEMIRLRLLAQSDEAERNAADLAG
jgi:hypothetical protein